MPTLSTILYLNETGKRSNLEDAIYPAPGTATVTDRVFLVCDGVGGGNKGEVASEIATRVMGDMLTAKPADNITEGDIDEALRCAIDEMRTYVEFEPGAANMATTLTAAIIKANGILVAWCGDSRVMHIRNGKLMYSTEDHSLVRQLVKQGQITEEEAAKHPQKNVITRAVNADGKNSKAEYHFIENVTDGDWLVLCTDGVLENLNADTISEIFTNDHNEQEVASLIRTLCAGKTNDNYSTYALRLATSKSKVETTIKTEKKLPVKGIMAAVVVVVGIIAYAVVSKSNAKQPTPPGKEIRKHTDSLQTRNGQIMPKLK